MKQRADGRWLKVKTINGKKVYFYSTAKTERAAIKDIEKQLVEYAEKDEKGKTFQEVAEEWKEEYLDRVEEYNFIKCGQAAYNRAVSWFGGRHIKAITANDIDIFLKSLISKGFSQKILSGQKSILNMIFNYAMLKGYCSANPTQVLTLPKGLPKEARKMPSTDEIRKIDSQHDGFAFFPYFLLYTGLRKSEALAVRFEDIDYKNKTISISKKIIYNGNNPECVNKTKTVNSVRTVPILDRLYAKLPKKKSGYLFADENGELPKLKRLQKDWDNWCKDNGLKVTAHQLRHAYATMLFEAGIDVKDAQELMGHSDINLTRSIYTHIRSERKKETVKKLNEFNF